MGNSLGKVEIVAFHSALLNLQKGVKELMAEAAKDAPQPPPAPPPQTLDEKVIDLLRSWQDIHVYIYPAIPVPYLRLALRLSKLRSDDGVIAFLDHTFSGDPVRFMLITNHGLYWSNEGKECCACGLS